MGKMKINQPAATMNLVSNNKKVNSGDSRYNCGRNKHSRQDYSAVDSECFLCKSKGHFAKYCVDQAKSLKTKQR